MTVERDGEIIARRYDRVADEYEDLESTESPWPRLRRVRAFAADLPPLSQILDIGCGNGLPATRELAARHEVTGIDISEEQITRARSNVPNSTFICGDGRENRYHGGSLRRHRRSLSGRQHPSRRLSRPIPALSPAPQAERSSAVERRARGWPGYTWLGVPMYINTIPTGDLLQVIQEAGFFIVDTQFESQLEGGKPIEYAWIVVETQAG